MSYMDFHALYEQVEIRFCVDIDVLYESWYFV